MDALTPRRIFREAALRRHLERPVEVHFPKLIAPATPAIGWIVLALLAAGAIAAAWSSVPEYAVGHAVAGERGWIVFVDRSDRLRVGQTAIIGAPGEPQCVGRVDRLSSSAPAGLGGGARSVELSIRCEPVRTDRLLPVRIELGRRRIATLIPGLREE